MNLQLQNKIIVVTGGAKGIGFGIAKALAAEGAFPVIIGRNETDNQSAIDEIKKMGGSGDFVTAELTRADECEKAIREIIAKKGTVHGLVNNAGVNDGVGLENGNYQGFIDSMHKNLVHYYLIAHHLLPHLKKNQGPILNISSKVADTGQGNTSAYAAANGGRNALTREWAVELAKYSIRVNAIIVAECYTPLYDAWIKTLPDPQEKLQAIVEKIPFEKRFTTAEEIAAMAVFLLSPLSGHTTGQLIYVDGGYVHLDRAMANA